MAPPIQTGPYIPRADVAFRDWGSNFAALIAADPARYGLDAEDAAFISSRAAMFAQAYVLAQSNETRTSAIVAAKDEARAWAERVYRDYAGLIKSNWSLSNAEKMALGLHVDDLTRSPIGPPRSCPLMMLVSAAAGRHLIRYADENTPTALRKPYGVAQLQLFVAITEYGRATPNDPSEARLEGAYTRQPIRVQFHTADAGKTATYFGRWVTARGLAGPFSLPRSMTIVGAGGGESASRASGENQRRVGMRMAA
ncbi:MAG: hypothetical protein IT430_02515 [Phycisphaerales bacterium]|nr:hypothetical protein [Phycisphaerales bacterium]